MKTCDNKSVGIIVRDKEGKILFIERKKYNFGFAPPSGHLDGDTPEDAARKELEEEVGLSAQGLKFLLEKTLNNPCKREGGTEHRWHVYEAVDWRGEIKPSEDEVKSYLWLSPEDINSMAKRLEKFAREHGLIVYE